jgi:hypothetical protein
MKKCVMSLYDATESSITFCGCDVDNKCVNYTIVDPRKEQYVVKKLGY